MNQQPTDPRLPVTNPNVEPEIHPPFKGGKRCISRSQFLHQISDSLSSAAVNCKLEKEETLLAYNTPDTAPLSYSLQVNLSKQQCFKNTAQEKAHTVALALTKDVSNK